MVRFGAARSGAGWTLESSRMRLWQCVGSALGERRIAPRRLELEARAQGWIGTEPFTANGTEWSALVRAVERVAEAHRPRSGGLQDRRAHRIRRRRPRHVTR